MEIIKWGLVGCGDIAKKRVAPAICALEDHRLEAIARKEPGRLGEFAEKFGVERTFTCAEELIEDQRIDAVYLATPVNLHLQHAVLAARAGKHVLCEKPMALDSAECDNMIEACDKAGVLLGVAYYRRFYPAVETIKSLLAGGTLGIPILARAMAAEFWRFEDNHPMAWRIRPEEGGGGPLMDFGSHRIDVLLDILGPVSKVGAFTDRLLFERRVEDSALVILRHASGAHSIVGAYHSIGRHFDELEISGSRGNIAVPSLNSGRLIMTGDEQKEKILERPPHQNLHLPLIEDFGRAINQGRQPRVTGRIARQTSRIMEAAYRAGKEGTTCRIE
jgi:predicted dehydrogenase